MTLNEILEYLSELEDAETLLLEPRSDYDEAIVGIGARFNDGPLVVYDANKIVDILRLDGLKSGLDEEEAVENAQEWFDFNIIGGWMGPGTPMFISAIRSDLP